MRCLALFTGGLDAQLAVRLVQEQGIQVVGMYVGTPLCATDGVAAKSAADRLGIELVTTTLDETYCDLLKRPRFGRLKFAAACTDCRIAMFAQAAQRMSELNVDFAISGEVVGQRPRTAIRDLEVVAHHCGLGDRLVRPLSARLLPATLPEERGWIDRSRLCDVQGKSRKVQRQLAAQFKIEPIPPPRPECPLLQPALSSRVLEMLDEAAELSASRLELAAVGKHHRLDARARIVVARNRAESIALAEMAGRLSGCTLVEPVGFAGPMAVIVGQATPASRRQAAQLIGQTAHLELAGGKPLEAH